MKGKGRRYSTALAHKWETIHFEQTESLLHYFKIKIESLNKNQEELYYTGLFLLQAVYCIKVILGSLCLMNT